MLESALNSKSRVSRYYNVSSGKAIFIVIKRYLACSFASCIQASDSNIIWYIEKEMRAYIKGYLCLRCFDQRCPLIAGDVRSMLPAAESFLTSAEDFEHAFCE